MQQPDMARLLQLMQSPEGQELVRYLKEKGGTAARDAAAQASSGDMSGAQQTLSPLLRDPKLRALLNQLGGTP